MNSRALLATVAGSILVLWGLWYLYSGWGLVSLDFENAPVSKVLGAISRQGGIQIATDLPPNTTVTIKVRRVPPIEALDIVAVRTESSWTLAYLGARSEAAIEGALSAFRSGRPAADWSGHGAGGFGTVESKSGAPVDLRLVQWQPASGEELQKLLQQAADETGVYLAAPSDWSPKVESPEGGRMAKAAPSLFRQAGGVSREVFLLRGPVAGDRTGDEGGGWRGGGTWIGAAARPGGARNPEAIAKRTEAQIQLLPPEERKKAGDDAAMMRDFWKSMRDLPPEERRAKAREFFSRPEVQERMEEQRLAREAKMTPEQRIQRSQRYWDRKAAARYRDGKP